MNDSERIPPIGQGSSIDEVLDRFNTVLRTSQASMPNDEFLLRDWLFERFFAWATNTGHQLPDITHGEEGGVEHDVLFDRSNTRVIKLTKPGNYAGLIATFDEEDGVFELERALPRQYLRRLNLQNRLLGDRVTFLGITGDPSSRRIVTAQPFVDGTRATLEEIIKAMEYLGFAQLPTRLFKGVGYREALGFFKENVAVLDLRPANVIKHPNGAAVPIDGIFCQLSESQRQALEHALTS